ncbi:MAG TPA: hypothetical protein DHW14_09800, partial [Clostridiales bacterium]|nr:hypothetical protein [Clostridiales bacterium]
MRARGLGRFCVILLAAAMVLLAVIGAGPPSASAEHGPWAALVGPVFARFVPGTSEWKIGLVAVGERSGEAGPRLGAVRAT